MTKVSLDSIKALREKTSASLADVRIALASAGGDEAKALDLLRQRGAQIAERRQDRATSQGRVEAYIHHDGRMGAIVEVACETDFVARTPEFAQFCRDLALHVAAMNPRSLSVEERSPEARGATDQASVECLLEQPFVKDPSGTIHGLLQLLVAKTGERVAIRRFARFVVGELTTASS
jgi:elongation factor Ts